MAFTLLCSSFVENADCKIRFTCRDGSQAVIIGYGDSTSHPECESEHPHVTRNSYPGGGLRGGRGVESDDEDNEAEALEYKDFDYHPADALEPELNGEGITDLDNEASEENTNDYFGFEDEADFGYDADFEDADFEYDTDFEDGDGEGTFGGPPLPHRSCNRPQNGDAVVSNSEHYANVDSYHSDSETESESDPHINAERRGYHGGGLRGGSSGRSESEGDSSGGGRV